MPRGNDAVEAAKELQGKYQASGNAHELIQSVRALRDPDHTTAGLLTPDVEADPPDLSEVQKESGVRGEVLTAQVRGDYVSYVWEDEDGRTYHGAYVREGTRTAVQRAKAGDKPEKKARGRKADTGGED